MIRALTILSILLLSLTAVTNLALAAELVEYQCAPTGEDELGPFYKPDTPVRNRIGIGYMLFGTVKSAVDCKKIPAARIEVWMTGPQGHYGDDWRATFFSAENGTYYFQSHVPLVYGNRPAHIHIKVTAAEHAELITQHYPVKNAGEAFVDLVLIPAE